jgi:hypothetical protein
VSRKIITEYVHPPIPIRQFDWVAFREGDDNDEDFLMGYGATADKAIADLLELESEDTR